MALYLEDVGTKKAGELIYDWQMKENSDKRIDDKVRYCNKVFVHVGKQAQQKLKDEVTAALNRMSESSQEGNIIVSK